MTIVAPRPELPWSGSSATGADVGAWWQRLGSTPQLLALATAAALLRLPYAGAALTPDEAGFSIVARQWHPGTSLYGEYWVDRPPLLLELFDLAARLGTPTGLRVLGCLAAFATTLFVALAARRASGGTAGFWAGAVAAVGMSSAALGAEPVNGELLAAPFVAGSVLCWVEGTRGDRRRRTLLMASGGCAAAAVLVKQNMVDGVVFFVVATAALLWSQRRTTRLSLRTTWPLVLPWVVGAVAVTYAVLAMAVARGSSVSGIWFAMYPFRVEAAGTMQGLSWHGREVALVRLMSLELFSAGPVLLALLLWLVVRARGTGGFDVRVLAPAVLVMWAYDVFSVAAGGSYWTHYLVQLVVPTALAAGVVAARQRRPGRAMVALVVALSLVLAAGSATRIPREGGSVVGTAVGAAADPHDTIVSALGDADIVAASGLHSDYEYLWSLPARTLDTRFATMATLLEGPHPPTWLVLRGRHTEATLLASAAGPAIRADYHLVTVICGRRVFLQQGVDRPTPVPRTSC